MSEDRIDLKTKFPNMTPVTGAPTMFSINGFGLRIYGERDKDRETHTYVTSHCITLLYIPLFWLSAYRVQPAGSDTYYFIGREPLSGFCKIWNLFVISSVLVFTGYGFWEAHTKSPDYVAGLRLEEARELKVAGKISESLRKYSEAMALNSTHREAANTEFDALIAERFDTGTADETTAMLQMVLNHRKPQKRTPQAKGWYDRSVARAKALADSDAKGGLKLLKAAEPLAADSPAHKTAVEALLEKAVAQNPKDMKLVAEWAVLLDAREDTAGLKKLLEPNKAQLGNTESARILGQIYAREGNIEESYALLEPYTTQRLKALHAASAAYESAQKRLSDNAFKDLKNGAAGQAWYKSYETANATRQEEMVNDFILTRMKNDASLKIAEAKLSSEAKIVPVAMDFGIVRLHRAQGMAGAAEKKKELESAEKVFLAIQGAAGESDQYLLYYGQVLFWLNRADEGQKQFDQLLAKNKREPRLLLMLANVFRELGDNNAALKLIDESYASAKKDEDKFAAASMRAVTSGNLEDKILWLGRSNPKEAHVRANLCQAQGTQALHDGDRSLAAAKFSEALKIYDGIPRSSTTLNNRAILHEALFAATGTRNDFKKSVELISEALSLDPKDSILMTNSATSLARNAMLDVMGSNVDYALAGTGPYLHLSNHLYWDEASQKAFGEKLAAHKDAQQATALLQRLLLLAPRSEQGYDALMEIYRATKNVEGLRDLNQRLKTVTLDVEEDRQERLELLKNGVKPDRLKSMKTRLSKLETDVKKIPAGADKLTWSLATDLVHTQQLKLYTMGEPVNLDSMVNAAVEVHAKHPSSNSHWNLYTVLAERAATRISQMRPEWKRQYQNSRMKFPAYLLLPGFLENSGELRARVTVDADLRRLVELSREEFKAFPNSPPVLAWKIVRQLDDGLAESMAAVLKKDSDLLKTNELEHQLAPFESAYAVELYWHHQLRGDAASAEKVKKTLTDGGMVWPLE